MLQLRTVLAVFWTKMQLPAASLSFSLLFWTTRNEVQPDAKTAEELPVSCLMFRRRVESTGK